MEPTDLAAPILQGDPALDDNARAELWNAFHDKNPEELAQHLQPLAIPDDTKRQLMAAKQQSFTSDPVTAAIARMASMDPANLDLAENHPTVLKTLTAALTPAPEVTPATAKTSTPKAPAEPEMPRADGMTHFPPIPQNHKRVLASDGGLHDIPAERLKRAREIDPNLHILNP